MEGEEEGGDGVSQTTEEQEEVGLGTRQSEPEHSYSLYIKGGCRPWKFFFVRNPLFITVGARKLEDKIGEKTKFPPKSPMS